MRNWRNGWDDFVPDPPPKPYQCFTRLSIGGVGIIIGPGPFIIPTEVKTNAP